MLIRKDVGDGGQVLDKVVTYANQKPGGGGSETDGMPG